MKKTIILLLGVAMISSITACSSNEGVSQEDYDRLLAENEALREGLNSEAEAKNWIHDADYEYDVPFESYTTDFGSTYYVKDIVVPFINIESADAEKANAEIKEVFLQAVEAYKQGIEDNLTYVDECKYIKYVDENILSVNLWLGIGATDVVRPEYFTYNFDLKTGKLLSYEEVYRYAGFTSDNISEKVETAITTKMQNVSKEFHAAGEDFYEENDFDIYNSESVNRYKSSVSDNSIKYFLDTNKKLSVIVNLYIPAGGDRHDTIIVVDMDAVLIDYSAANSQSWRSDYEEFLKDPSRYAEDAHYAGSFAAVDMDNDGIPELIILYYNEIEGGSIFANVYTHNGNVKLIGERMDMHYKSCYISAEPSFPGVFVSGGRSSMFKCYYWTKRSDNLLMELLWEHNIDTYTEISDNEQLLEAAEKLGSQSANEEVIFVEINSANIQDVLWK
ncbi:MAG: hypothetical protein FWH07_04850 [Oscillospiraceae bacterium]|nr:hypothetical protein [Oscillospiraceae bacterium]